jgi:hypothetical protein
MGGNYHILRTHLKQVKELFLPWDNTDSRQLSSYAVGISFIFSFITIYMIESWVVKIKKKLKPCQT